MAGISENYTAISSQNRQYINILKSNGGSHKYIWFPHKSVTMNGKVVTIISENGLITFMDENGSNRRSPTGIRG